MRTGISLSLNTQSALRSFPQTFGLILSMQENSKDQPPSLSQLLLDNYLAETAVHHKHSRINPDTPSSPHLLYGSFRGSAEDSNVHEELQLPDLSAFLSQEELDKSVDLARQAISHEPSEQEESHKPSFVPYMGTDLNSTHNSTQYAPEKMDILPTLEPFTPERQSVESIKDNGLRISRTSRDQHVDFKRPVRNTPYGLETQSKKEFLNKAADFIEELSSLFKANSSKRIRPRACKAHSRQNQNKAQASSVSTSLNLNDRERPVFHINQQLELTEFQSQDSRLEEEPFNPVTAVQCEPLSEVQCESAAIKAQSSEEQLYEPPHFIQKLKSREVPEGSKVQLDCIVRGIPTPEVRWFCEGKELENSPDIQIINNGELHSLVIAEAFEEDTGRYSCFASNICGTDSTSAEIYIEGASSSDSEAEQHFETQKHKRVQHTTAALQSVGSEPGNTGLTTLPTEVVPSLPTAPVLTVTPSAKVSAAQLSVLEESPAPITSMESTPSTTPTIILPTPTTAGQGTFNQEYTPVHPSQPNMVENQNNYPQGLDGKPIIAAPVFTKSLQDLVAYEGQLVVLECRVKGVPSPKVQWYREGTFIEDSPDFRILQKKPRSTAESEEICTLVIAEVFPEDSGKFTCTASNKYGTVSSTASLTVKGNEDNSFAKVMNNQTVESPSSQEPEFNNSCLKHPSSSCLKTRPEGVLVNPNESRVNSRVGLRVTFKLPEDEEVEEENDIPCSKSSEDIYPVSTNKEPPPVLAKPKLDPMQLQILHNQVLLEQQQGNSTQNHQEPSWSDVENIKPIVDSQYPVLPNSLPSKHKSDPSPLINPRHTPQLIASTVSLLSSTQTPLLHAVPVPHLKTTPEAISLSVTQPNMAPNAQINSMTQSAVDQNTLVSQCNMGVTPPAHQLNVGSTTLPLQHSLASINPISHLSMVSPPPVNQPIINPSIPMPQSSIAHSAPVLHLGSETSNQLGVNPNARLSMNSMTPSTELNSSISIAPSTQLNSTSMPQMRMASVSPVSSAPTTQRDMAVIPTHHLNAAVPLETSSAVTKLDTNPAAQISVGLSPVLKTFSSPQLDAGHMSLPSTAPSHLLNKPLVPATSVTPVPFMNTIQASLTEKSPVSNVSTSQTFNYARPKEFVAAQTLSPVRSPVTTLQDLTLEGSSPLGYITQSPRMFPTRVLESPNSPTVHISSPTFVPSARLSSVFALRTQSPPQAPSPSSSSSTPSPIQNPVAFLSSVLPSLPTSPPTNAMGLPMSAPAVPPSILRKNAKGLRPISDEDSHDVSESLLQNIEKKLRFKDESTPYGQQKLTYEGKESRPLGPNIPTATVINYDEEYKVSNFEQRLMSEIEFRLERTPVEESDDEIQHDDIPRGKCIAPLFDKKLKNYRAVEGIPVTFTCKVVGIPIPKVYWFKDGKQILKKNEQYKKIREGDGTCSLHIEAVTNNDDGNYTVMAANPQGRASCSGHLIVQVGPVRNRPVIHTQRVRTRVQEVEGEPTQERFFKPHFLQAPGDLVSQEGRLCRLDCKVNGLPHPELMWLLNGKPIYPDVCHRMLVRENGIHSLVIDPLTQNDAGMYTCIATNKAGQNSFSLELKVVERENKQPPQFVEKLQNTGIAEGLPIRLECRIVGMPPPVIYWKKDNDTITQSKDRFSIHQDATGYVCLLIQPTRKEDAGWYTVSAKNEAGIISCTARLDIYAQWHQQIHQPIKKLSQSGGSYATFGGHGLDIKSAFPSTDIMFSSSAQEATPESEEL